MTTYLRWIYTQLTRNMEAELNIWRNVFHTNARLRRNAGYVRFVKDYVSRQNAGLGFWNIRPSMFGGDRYER